MPARDEDGKDDERRRGRKGEKADTMTMRICWRADAIPGGLRARGSVRLAVGELR